MLRYESSCTVLVANEYTLLNRLRKPETRCPASGSFVAEHHLERAGSSNPNERCIKLAAKGHANREVALKATTRHALVKRQSDHLRLSRQDRTTLASALWPEDTSL